MVIYKVREIYSLPVQGYALLSLSGSQGGRATSLRQEPEKTKYALNYLEPHPFKEIKGGDASGAVLRPYRGKDVCN